MIKYANTLLFDKADHEIHSKQVQAWIKRHNVNFDDVVKGAKRANRMRIEAIKERYNGITNIE